MSSPLPFWRGTSFQPTTGIVGMVATLTGLLTVFASLGLSLSTIQRPNLTFGQVHNIFWINAAIGVLLWALSAVAAPQLADFYDEPALTAVTIVLGASFAINGLAEQPRALLHRWMRFRAITLLELATQVAAQCWRSAWR